LAPPSVFNIWSLPQMTRLFAPILPQRVRKTKWEGFPLRSVARNLLLSLVLPHSVLEHVQKKLTHFGISIIFEHVQIRSVTMNLTSIVFLLFFTLSLSAEGDESGSCAIDNLKCLQAKIRKGEPIDLQKTNFLGRTSLHYAVEKGDLDLVKNLVVDQPSENVNASDLYGNSPLHLAVIHNQKEILEYLLHFTPDINQMDRHGETALDLAMASGQMDTRRLLESRGAESKTGGKSYLTVYLYLVYIVISIGITIWVATTLSKNGRFFLVDAFHNEELADSVNHLLVVGFYLINLGYITLALKIGMKPTDAVESLEILSSKIGLVILILGAMHFFNLFLLGRLRKRTLQKREMASQN